MKNGWATQKLGELLEIQNGYAFNSKAFSPTAAMPLIRIRDLRGGVETETRFDGAYDEKYVVEAGDLLIGMDGEFGCYEWKGKPALLNQRVCRLQGFRKELMPRFLFYGVNSYLKDIEDVTGYATVKHLSSKQILNIDFPHPPLHEQRRIVGILDEAFAGIATAKVHAEKNLQNARALFESHLNAVFTQRRDGWVEKPLGDVVLFQGGSQPPKSVFRKERKQGYVRLIQIRDYKSDKHIVYIPEKAGRRQCTADDVMIGRYGPPLFQILRGIDGAYNVALMKATPDETQISKDYLYYFLKNGRILAHVIHASHRAAGQTGLKREMLEAYPIPYPKSLSRQAEIVSNLESLYANSHCLESIYQRKLAALDELKKSLLHKAFSGQL